LNAETIAHFGIGYCPKGIMAGRIAIPIHNADGHIVANAGRWPGDSPVGKDKYRLPGKFKKTLEVFNYHRASIEPDASPLVIVEGFFGVMHLWQLGIRRVVAFMGWHMSARQEEMIAKLITSESRIILMLDNDEAGITATQEIAPRLAEHCFVRSFRWTEGFYQPDQLEGENFLTSLA
jgi:DNA primase